jgi:hypothetical protein
MGLAPALYTALAGLEDGGVVTEPKRRPAALTTTAAGATTG